jgi:translation initiation factor 2B subunit (eIF-2B alpha/beta/delta family)
MDRQRRHALMPEVEMKDTRTSPRGDSEEITNAEIAQVERLLVHIAKNNTVLGNAAQWLLAWTAIRDVSHTITRAHVKMAPELAPKYKRLLNNAIAMGEKSVGDIQESQISAESLILATGCDVESINACISFLRDQRIQWFDESVSESEVFKIWKGTPREPMQEI